jgi:ribosomal protein S18 acetylase RimI-like enzyme
MNGPHASLADVRLLDKTVWSALSTEQSYLAEGNGLAKRFPRDVAPFAAIREQSSAAYEALATVLDGDAGALAFATKPVLPVGWVVQFSEEIYQMVLEGPIRPTPKPVFRQLTEEDVPAMLALTKLTKPGPFLPRTIELGSYLGIFYGGSLVAMAGERFHLSGFREVSAVCTHPEYAGRGYGAALMSAVMEGIADRGETPFLHVITKNPALGLYQRLGFKVRAQVQVAVIKYAPA